MSKVRRAQPTNAGDIVSCYFPYDEDSDKPGPDLRPALVVKVDLELGAEFLHVAYGTGQNTPDKNTSRSLGAHYFHMNPQLNGGGLEVETSFNMAKVVRLPCDSRWFSPWRGRNTILVCRVPESKLADAKAALVAGEAIAAARQPSGGQVAVTVRPKRRLVSLPPRAAPPEA